MYCVFYDFDGIVVFKEFGVLDIKMYWVDIDV